MVTFTTDPRIAYARARQQAGMKQAMTPYQLPRNPYGGSPIAGNLQRLADALGARWAGADAARLQEGQKTAQSKILARLLGAQTGVPGREQYARGQIQVPTQDVQVTGEYRPTPTGGGWQRLTIDDTGATVPDPAVLDPAVLKTAGLSPGEYSILERKAKLEGAKISEAERISFAEKKLGEATTQKDRKYWLAQVDAIKAAERALDKEPTPVQLSTSISSMVTKVASMSEDGESSETIAAFVRSQMETFPDNQQMQDAGTAIIAASTEAAREAAAGRQGIADVAKSNAIYAALLERPEFEGREEEARVIAYGGRIVGAPISEEASRLKTSRQSIELLTNLGTLDTMLEKGWGGVAGPFAALKGFVNVTLANFNPALFSKKRAKFEQFVETTRQSALRVVSDESRFSEADRDFIFALFPKTGIFESPQQAAVKLDVLTAFFLRRLVQVGSLTQEEAAASPIPTLTAERLRDFYHQGLITQSEAIAIAPVLFPERFKK